MKIKPQLAEDAVLDKVVFPCIVQTKVDGVRAMNLDGTLTGRSLDPFKGFGITEYFSGDWTLGLDGEMTLGDKPNSADRLCSLTTGAIGRFKDVTEMVDLHWWVFDLVNESTVHLSYSERYARLGLYVMALNHPRIHLMPSLPVANDRELQSLIATYSEMGYEGTIIRNPESVYKAGRSTKEGQLWRVKPWADFEILVTGITEGQRNENEAKKNSLGRTERSSAQAGMAPNGQVGSIQGVLVADFFDPTTGKLLFAKGLEVTAGSGEMSVKDATWYFDFPTEIIGHIAKVKTMTHGVKDLPRFPTYVSHRLPEDMS